METQTDYRPAELAHVVAVTTGYASALADSDGNRVHENQRCKLKELIGRKAQLCGATIPQVKKKIESLSSANQEQVRVALVQCDFLVEALTLLLPMRDALAASDPSWIEVWPDSAQQLLERTCDIIEEARETLAIGLSPAFQQEVDSARKEAGLDDAKGDLPAR